KTFTLTVTFKIQAGCLNVSPTTLTFTGVAGTSDPSPQTVRLNNCGLAGTWSGTPTTDAGGNWLSITPPGAAIDTNANGTQSVTVTASNVRTKLPVGRYTGRITFTIGGTQVGVAVTLIVNPPPVIAKLSASPTLLTNTNETCRYGETGYTCHVTLSSNKDASSSLNWKASISGGEGISVSENSGTLAPGESQDVIVTIPSGNCGTTATITFQGPSNAVDVGIKWASCIK
ncbi:MAG: hypothetical protein IMW89_19350, partial [Ktedonobacteraceae bacterium]|nr:hypothetical protein [Ktedonobacteraceae bacterium]